MVQRANSQVGDVLRKGFPLLALMLLSLAGACRAEDNGTRPQKFSSIKTNGRGVVLTGAFDASSKANYAAIYPTSGYPDKGLVNIRTENGAPGRAISEMLQVKPDGFTIEISEGDLPSIAARQTVGFALKFSDNLGVSFEGNASFETDIGPPTGTRLSRMIDSLSPTTLLILCVCLLVSSVVSFLWPFLRRRSRGREAASRRDFPPGEEGGVAPMTATSNGVALDGLRVEFTALIDASAGKLGKEVQALREGVDGLREQLASSVSAAASRDKSLRDSQQEIDEQMRLVANSLGEMRPDVRVSVERGGQGSARSATAVASVVNEWLTMGVQSRAPLLELAASAAVLNPRLAEYSDTGMKSSKGEAEYRFNFPSDGSWLWVNVEGSQDFWAAPADSTFMTMGETPAMLHLLFEGMQDAGLKFRFKAIYRPCRLRPVAGTSDRFTVVERGLLHLQGKYEPEGPRPPAYAEMVQVQQVPLGGTGVKVGGLLGAWIKGVSEQMRECQRDVDLLSEDVRTRPVVSTATHEAALKGLRDRMGALEGELRRNAGQTATAIALVQAAQAEVARVETSASPVGGVLAPGDAPDRVPRDVAARVPVVSVGALSAAVAATGSVAEPTLDALSVSELSGEGVPLAGAVDEVRLSGSGVMLPSWQGAFERAAAVRESEAEEVGVPSKELYLRRVAAYCRELALADSRSGFAVAHFQRVQVGNQFFLKLEDLRDESEGGTGGAAATTSKAPAWQFAVRAGRADGDVFYLLFPRCLLDKSNYAAVYSELIENLPEVPFSTEAMDGAAVLSRDRTTGLFSIKKKIRLVDSASTGRG